ncbi:MAG: PBP1A family penicillin-binding protein [Ideonella sp.]|nr:PBP1A family penicillin-binding protein [Ideonella sp.]
MRWRWRWWLVGAAASLLAAVLGMALYAVVQLPELPALDRVTDYQPRQPLQVLTSDGAEIAQFGTERRQFTPIADMPKLMRDALLSVEDARFYRHFGIDLLGLARAVLAMASGGMRQGASTITQQVARTFFLSPRITAERKVKEALLSLQIEQRLSKDQILELYMNQIYLGQRAYGFSAASQVYFGKPLHALSVAEVAMLAGLPQNPNYANPITNFERARQRQRTVLKRMLDTGVITTAQWTEAREQVLRIRSPASGGDLHAEYVAEMARRIVVERFGTEVYSQGIRVVTSIRAADQAAAWAALRRGVLDHDRKQAWRGPEDQESLADKLSGAELERAAALALREHRDDETLRVAIVLNATPRELRAQLATGEAIVLSGEGLRWAQAGLVAKPPADLAIRRGSVIRVVRAEAPNGKAPAGGANDARWAISQWPEAQAALVAMDPGTGRVRAWVGGFDFHQQPFDHVSQAWRQPGSSFKPFLYSAALEHGVMPATQILDAPLTGAATEGGWDPQNSDGKFDGPLSLRQGLVKSKNLVSIRLLQQIGLGPVRDWVARFGFEGDRQPDNLTLALGAGSTTPLQMAQAYAVLANGGQRVTPVVIERITDAKGQVLFEVPAASAAVAEPVIPARNLFITNSMLGDVTRIGTAAKAQAQLNRADLYGKTGTTNDAVDAWFAGFQPSLVAVVWMGHDEPRSLGERESGGGLALPIWINYMRLALAHVPVAPLPVPPDGVQRLGEDWVYSEWAGGGFVQRIGIADPAVEATGSAAAAASAPSVAPDLPRQ